MLMVISPAKTLDFDSTLTAGRATQPALLEHSGELNRALRAYSSAQLSRLMKISPALAELNVRRNLDWRRPFTAKNARQAILAFKGDVYVGLDADTFAPPDFAYAQQHLRILSGLYGVLRPLDLMQPYRLEMGTRLRTEKGGDLYAFWGPQISQALNRQLTRIQSDTLLNLASNEYYRAVDPQALRATVVTPVFKDWKNGEYKLISFFAKRARGALAAWVIRNRVTRADDLPQFDGSGYRYSRQLSAPDKPVFLRKQ